MMRVRWFVLAAWATAFGASCKGDAAAPAQAPAPAPAAAAATPGVFGQARVAGRARLLGPPPDMPMQARDTDAFCQQKPARDDEVVVGRDGGLANVVVRVTKGASGRYAPPAAPVAITQEGCAYKPRVQVAMAGQSLSIANADGTLHNVHGFRGPSTLFNSAQVTHAPPITRPAGAAGDVLKLKCDVHPWMTGWVLVTDNPFFAVTDADGGFVIDKLPDGRVTLEAWHERYGTRSAEVTVVAGKPTDATFDFK